MFHETLDPSWNNLLENTFNQVSDILGETVEEIDFEEQMPDEASVVNIDSRLDSDSVLIEDIALDIIRGKDTVISVDEAVTQKTVITELKPHILKMEMGECFNNSGENNLQSFQRGTAYNLERRDDLSPLPMGDGRDALADSIHPMEDSCADLGTDLQPHLRDRCNTWPRRQLESCYSSCSSEEGDRLALPQDSPPPLSSPRSQAPGLALVSEEGDSDGEREEDFPTRGQDGYRPKLNSRRNPWGNFSYAELITQAVQSSPEHRLTLSQIYDWMISTVPYFQERADPSASAGWKNSIRHNLSLHQRFVKVQNEGAGKSSWWTINPEKRTVMKPRRRATSGDTRTMSIKRDKAKKRTEALKSGGRLIRSTSINGINPPLSPLYDSRVPPHFNYHDNGGSASYVTQLRARSLSNASSLGCPSFLQQPPEDQNQLNFPNLDYLNTLNTIKREEAEWENIAMDNLHLDGKAPMMNQREMIRGREELEDYLQPQPGPVLSEPGRRHKIKILEPRNPVCAAVLPNQSKSTQQQYNYNEDLDSYVSPLLTRDGFDQNEVRRPLIIKELNQLTRKKAEVIDNQNTHILTDNNKKNLESAFDIKIWMLQEELDKMSREEEINRINQFSKASNNPYFTGNTGMGRQEPFYSHQHMSYNECMMQYLPMEVMEHSDGMDADRDPDVMQQVLDQELRNLDRRNFEYSDIRNPFNRLPEVTT